MEQVQLEEILQCLEQNRIKFYYHKDRYALMLLSYFVKKGLKISEIRDSRFKRLLDKPLVKEILKKSGNQYLNAEQLYSYWSEESHCYLLSLDGWGGRKGWLRFCDQTSRPGWNLVLQLNFSEQHNGKFRRLVKPVNPQPFKASGHPVSEKYHTLAWARIDLDLETNEALIEEIQTDWLRLAGRAKQFLEKHGEESVKKRRWKPHYIRGLGCGLTELNLYLETVLKTHSSIWQEAILSAAIALLREDIGINHIFYHTFDSGCLVKRIDGSSP